MDEPTNQPSRWSVNGRLHELGDHPWIMGIVNVTPDSFSDGGKYLDPAAAVAQGLTLVDQGADILDIGGESTRPGAAPVSADDELRRVIPVIEQLAEQTDVLISIDTTKADVAETAIQAGATVVNDVSALTLDPRMPEVCSRSDCGVVLMHMQGTPQTMQEDPRYDDVVVDIVDYLRSRISMLTEQGIAAERIVIDPGIGFGKTADHNLALLSNIASLRASGRPVLVGHSRKRFLGKLLGKSVDERTSGTIGVSIALAEQQADILRVHDVAAVKDALTAWRTIRSGSR